LTQEPEIEEQLRDLTIEGQGGKKTQYKMMKTNKTKAKRN